MALQPSLAAIFFEGGHLSAALVNGPAALIVLGGTIGAAVLQTPKDVLLRSVKLFAWMIKPPTDDFDELHNKIVDWARVARKNGLLGLEKVAMAEAARLFKKRFAIIG